MLSSGEEFRDAYRRALADRHKTQRNKRGRRPSGMQRADFGTSGYRREPPSENSSGKDTAEGFAGATPQLSDRAEQ